ncbi:hypothetical protein APA_2836 [Pseudanabaena sp. lw0831]|uniref:hypothetical protein n=1 Tax=Pseudanabaena sp. lw0831 TaxID=1357935 RepID=UPI001916CA2F|nr:hypothetical protein [Pseudanabaena sp. lw0831]GBO54785.1 hypothetical protein APA_2836 [Pseudanabaena sp. lw0831]
MSATSNIATKSQSRGFTKHTHSYSHYETYFGVSSAVGAENSKIGFAASQPLADLQQNLFL